MVAEWVDLSRFFILRAIRRREVVMIVSLCGSMRGIV